MNRHPLFGPVSQNHAEVLLSACMTLLNHLDRLLAHAPEPAQQAIEDLQLLVGPSASTDAASREKLDSIAEALKGKLKDAPLAAMIAADTADQSLRVEGRVLSAWVLAAALRRLRITPEQNAIGVGLTAMRLLKEKAPGILVHFSPLPTDLGKITTALDVVAETKGLSSKERHYLTRINALLRSARNEGAAIHRTRGLRLTSYLCSSEQGVVDEIPEALDEGVAGPEKLQADDRSREVFGFLADGDGFAPGRAARHRAAQAARSAGRRELALMAEHDPLTPLEIAVLVQAAQQEPSSLALNKLLALLAFGTATPASLRDGAGDWKSRGQHIGVELWVKLPSFEPVLEDLDTARNDRLFLPAPRLPDVALAMQEVNDKVLRENFTVALKKLTPSLARGLTPGRIMRYKADWLRRAGADPAIVGFLLGISPSERAQMHYTSVDIQILQNWHNRYLQALGLVPAQEVSNHGRYGARMQIPKSLLQLVFEEQKRRLRALRLPPVASFAQLRKAHDAYAIYTLMLLYFATGHRPVTYPFEYLADMDLDQGLMWIADKVGRGGRGSRMIVLPDSARIQVLNWCDHLRRLAERLDRVRPDIVKARILPALETRPREGKPLFFLLDDGGTPLEINVVQQKNALIDILPAPLNWARHVLRSTLVARGAMPDALDAFLGHAHLGAESFAPASALRIDDLRGIAREVERILQDHGAVTSESPL